MRNMDKSTDGPSTPRKTTGWMSTLANALSPGASFPTLGTKTNRTKNTTALPFTPKIDIEPTKEDIDKMWLHKSLSMEGGYKMPNESSLHHNLNLLDADVREVCRKVADDLVKHYPGGIPVKTSLEYRHVVRVNADNSLNIYGQLVLIDDSIVNGVHAKRPLPKVCTSQRHHITILDVHLPRGHKYKNAVIQAHEEVRTKLAKLAGRQWLLTLSYDHSAQWKLPPNEMGDNRELNRFIYTIRASIDALSPNTHISMQRKRGELPNESAVHRS